MKNAIITSIILIAITCESFTQQEKNSLNFDGTDDFVVLDDLANDLQNLQNFTVEFWMKADMNVQNGNRVSLFSINDSEGNVLLLVMGGKENEQEGKLIVVDQNPTPSNFVIESPQIIGDNKCHHIAYIKKAHEGSLYIDGNLIGQHEVTYNLAHDFRYSVGQEWDNQNTSNFYNGDIDELRIWSEPRTEIELLSTLSIPLSENEPGLIGYYSFDQGIPFENNSSEIILQDLSGNNNDGFLINFSLVGQTSNWVTSTCMFCDCNGEPNGTAVVDDCGECLKPTDPDFNQSCADKNDIYIPNAFSPNGDGNNDRFQVYKSPETDAQIKNYLIYSRWGGLIYEQKNLEFGHSVEWWDGKIKTRKAISGVYVYFIEIEFQDGETRQYEGDVTIVK